MKLKLENIRGFNDPNDLDSEQINAPANRSMQLGLSLLSSENEAKSVMNIIGLRHDQIKKNPKNTYSIQRIPELAESIRIMGLASPLNVRKALDTEEGEYILLGGERRLTAIETLISDPSVETWNDETLIPCLLVKLEELDFSEDMSDDFRERYALISTNKESRTYTDADRYNEAQEWKLLIQELREKGVETFDLKSEASTPKKLKIKGQTTRDIIAEASGMSRGMINKIEKVKNQGADEIIDAVKDGEVSISTAYNAVTSLSREEQKEFLKSEKTTSKDLQKYKETLNQDECVLDAAQFRKDTCCGQAFL